MKSSRRGEAEAASLTFADIAIGDIFELSRAFSEDDVDAFAALSGDFSPLHIDPNYAGASEFGSRVVHGMLTASLFSALVGMHIPGRAALYLGQELNFRRPALIGEELTARAKVTGKSAAIATLSLAMEIRDRQGRVVVSGGGRVKVRGASAAATDAPLEARRFSPTGAQQAPLAIVTGGVRGIGRAIAERLVGDGYRVIAVYRSNQEAARSLAAAIAKDGGVCKAVQADITSSEAVHRLMTEVEVCGGPVRVLVNAAVGELMNASADELKWEDFASHLDTQVKGAFELAKRVHPLMKAAGGGAIVNILSQVVHNVPPVGLTHYVTAKYGLLGLSKALAVEWAADNIRVNMVSPGLTRTELTQGYNDRIFTMEALKTPLRRLVDPTEIADAVAYLAGPGMGFVTGMNLFLSGGQDMP